MAQVLDALAYAHQLGFVHRDIKPANLLLIEATGKITAKVADFGLARTYQNSQMSGLTIAGASGGTPLFMPPEQITDFRGVKPTADQYSAAATLYYLLTSMAPFEAKSVQDLFRKILLEEPTRLRDIRPEVPVALENAILRAMSRKVENRFADATAFRQAIVKAVS